jgi:prophage antirepressor-like protein
MSIQEEYEFDVDSTNMVKSRCEDLTHNPQLFAEYDIDVVMHPEIGELFCLTNILKAIDYTKLPNGSFDSSSAIKLINEKYRTKLPVYNEKMKRSYDQWYITEFGVYQFLGRTNAPKAEVFQEWTYKVLRQIRKTGSYNSQPTNNLFYERIIELMQKQIDHQQTMLDRMDKSITFIHDRSKVGFSTLDDKIIDLENAFKASSLQIAAANNKSANSIGNNITYLGLNDAKNDPDFQNKIKKYSERKGYMSLSRALKEFACKRGTNIKKNGSLNMYPKQIISDFFDPRYNPDISSIIPFNK